jgi:RNA polymerase sigma-70 factor, ECF subfamily
MKSSFADEKILLHELKAGNRDALVYLYQEYRYWMLLQAAAILKDEVAAQDLVNELFADFWEFKLYENINTSLKGYLSSVVRNKAYNQQRTINQQAKKRMSFPIQEYLIPDVDIEREEIIEKLELAIEKLPPKMLTVFSYFFKDGLSQKQIANITGKSRYTVSNQIDQAKKLLKKELKK